MAKLTEIERDDWLGAVVYYGATFGLFWALHNGQTFFFILSLIMLVKMWRDD